MNLGLNDQVILVSGGGSGIGQAISRSCLEEGALVVVAGRRTEEVDAFQQDLAATRAERCIFFHTELADPLHCEEAIDLVRTRFGRLDGLVNSAGANDHIGLETGDPHRFEGSLRQNLLHYYSLAHFALPLLKETRGSIVNISSKVAVTGQGGTSAYAAAKGAQLALTREWAAELLPYGVRVNAVVPAEVLTPLYLRWLAETDSKRSLRDIEQRIPLNGRLTHAQEIAAAVAFLLSPTMSGHTTAQHVFVDGGYTHLDRALTSGRAVPQPPQS
jgi:L-fucose dehydrogenase